MNLTFILAMDENNLIGSNNGLPWKLPADLQYFKQQTINKTILMGRKTCESLPFSLPKRRNVVLTKNINFSRQGFDIIHKIDSIKDLDGEIMIIGGAQIYKLLMQYANKLLITKIQHKFNGDTYFAWQENAWQLTSQTIRKADDKNPYYLSFNTYQKI